MDDFVYGSRLGRLFFVSNRAIETHIEERAERRLAEISRQIALLDAPEDGGPIELAHAGCNHGSAQRAPAQAREDERVWLTIQHRVDVFDLNPPSRKFGSIAGLAHIRFGAEQARRFGYSFFKRQVFEGMQSVVVDEDPNRTLHWEQVRRVIDGFPELVTPRPGGMTG